jgi:hypothetical protein
MNVSRKGAVERDIRSQAERLLKAGTNAADFSQAVFGPDGLLRKLWTTDTERLALVDSPLYRWLEKEQSKLRKRDARTFAKQVESLSGRLTEIMKIAR